MAAAGGSLTAGRKCRKASKQFGTYSIMTCNCGIDKMSNLTWHNYDLVSEALDLHSLLFVLQFGSWLGSLRCCMKFLGLLAHAACTSASRQAHCLHVKEQGRASQHGACNSLCSRCNQPLNMKDDSEFV